MAPHYRILARPSSILFSALVMALVFIGSCATAEMQSADTTSKRKSKVSPELSALYEEYSAFLAANPGAGFHSRNAMVRVVDDRVIIDAVASGDVSELKSDLASLGMKNIAAFGRIISGQLPISALPALSTLSSLQFARGSGAVSRGGRQPIVPPDS